MVEINDRIYGKEVFEEEIFEELIESKELQRLKDISQLGMPDKYYFRKGYSRFEHSLGVSILLKKLGASLEEQVAGLLHDVSHTTFSHVIDWVVGDPIKEDYQDNILLKIIEGSEIPNILNKHGFDYRKIANHKNFSLLEREAPSLCADRMDYTLREINQYNSDLSKEIFGNLFVKNEQIVFRSLDLAKIFAEEYVSLQSKHWAGDQARARYYILSNILKKGLNEKYLSLEDFNKTESFVLDVLENSGDEFILENLNVLKKGFEIVEDNEGVELKKKFRYIDPEVSVNGLYKPLTFLSREYSQLLDLEKEKSKLVRKIKIIPH